MKIKTIEVLEEFEGMCQMKAGSVAQKECLQQMYA